MSNGRTCSIEMTQSEYDSIVQCESVVVMEYERELTGDRFAKAMAWGDRSDMEDQVSMPGFQIVPVGVKQIGYQIIDVEDLIKPMKR